MKFLAKLGHRNEKKGLKSSVLALGNFSCDLVCSEKETRMLFWPHLGNVKCKIPGASRRFGFWTLPGF